VSEIIKEHRFVISLGSNISPIDNLRSALYLLGRIVDIEAVSSFWKTTAVGSQGPEFLNAAVLASGQLSANELKNQILRPIENLLGRVRTKDPNAPRTIDLDILIYDSKLLELELWEFAHLCVPVAEILPEFNNPLSGETIKEVSGRLFNSESIRRFPLELHRSSSTRDIV
jgi:2-amino-4-hydroxy-6-hydroxymethyldihydropteridine diphosphokinase